MLAAHAQAKLSVVSAGASGPSLLHVSGAISAKIVSSVSMLINRDIEEHWCVIHIHSEIAISFVLFMSVPKIMHNVMFVKGFC